MQLEFKKPDIIPKLLLLWFVLHYYSQILPVQQLYAELIIEGIVILTGGLIILKSRGIDKRITKSSLLLLVYFTLLFIVLIFSSLFGVDPTASFISVMYSILTYVIAFFIFQKTNELYAIKINWRIFLSKTFLVAMLIIIIGQLILPSWKMGIGGVRLTGGANPNYISFFALFVIFISHYNSLLNTKFLKIDKINWLLANIILIWSMSRSSYLGYGVFYIVYFGWFFLKSDLSNLFKGKIKISLLIRPLLVILVIPIFILLYSWFSKTSFYNFTVMRLLGESGLTSRTLAWDILMEYFKGNPLFGGIGWWNASDVIPNIDGVANSVHNLYVRLLSEIGIIGMVVVLALPIFIGVGLIIKSIFIKNKQIEKIMMLTSSFLVGTFILQLFEDKFLIGIFGIGNYIIIWVLALGYLLINKKILIEGHPIRNKKIK